MALKKDDTKLIERILRNSRFWRSSEPFTVADCHNALIGYKPLAHIERRRVQTVLHELLRRAEIEKAGPTEYRVRSSKKELISRAWR